MSNWRTLAGLLRDAGSSLAEDLALAGEAARLGGAKTLAYYRRASLSIDEERNGPVTAADRASHHAIVEFLHRLRPQDAILSEEGQEKPAASSTGRLWIVDPLDGTREFIEGIGEFSVMVGLAIDGRAILGAVYRPDRALLYLGIADQAAWRLEDGGKTFGPLSVSENSGDGLRLARSRSHPDARLRDLELALAPTEVIPSGSVGVKCILIAEGKADLYVHPVPYLKEWDTCAPEAILRGAGGRISDCLGQPLVYGKPDPVQQTGIFAATHSTWLEWADEVARSIRTL